jgi:hypothetical protein
LSLALTAPQKMVVQPKKQQWVMRPVKQNLVMILEQ